jgi:two-component system osmolarity sensor histidine kinase EnvZ
MLKALLPQSLFGRALIIIVTPVIVLQLIAGAVFYDRHLQTVTRRLAVAVGGDIAYVLENLAEAESAAERDRLFERAQRTMGLRIRLLPAGALPPSDADISATLLDRELLRNLEHRLPAAFSVQHRPGREIYLIHVAAKRGILRVEVPVKRFTSATAHILAWWVIVSSALLLAIAILFLRNQVKPIRRLAEAADRFGKGQDVAGFRPSGAAEVRRAAAAFLTMRERIDRQIRQRTEMLAGVSHDLRTPLTRMKLQLALLGEAPGVAELKSEVEEMTRLVEEYLAFARGAQGEAPVETDVARLLAEVADEARRQGGAVQLETDGDMIAELRPQALKRCVANLVDNARRYAKHTEIRARRTEDAILISVDDDGPGIPEAARREVFRPFHRLDDSRNPDTGGVGLGLAIARDTIRSHGGDVSLETAPLGGLRALVRLPV